MARQEIQIQINTAVESAQSAQTLGQLRRALIDIRDLQSEIGDESSPQFQQLQNAAAQTTRRLAQTREAIGDINDSVRTLDGSPIERMNNSFGLLRESVANVDFDKFRIGLSGIGNALKANPIFMLGATIVAITAAVGGVLAAFGLLGPVLDGIKNMVQSVKDAFTALTDAMGITREAEKAAAEESKRLYEERRARIDQEAALFKQMFNLRAELTQRELKDLGERYGLELDFLKDLKTEKQLEYEITQSQIFALQQEYDAIQARRDLTRNQLEEDKKRAEEITKAIADLNQKSRDQEMGMTIEAYQIKTGLEKTYNQLVIDNITNSREKRRREIEENRRIALQDLENKLGVLEEENVDFAQKAAMKVAINKRYNQELAAANAAFRREDAQEALDALNNEFRVKLLLTEENTEDRLVVEQEFRDAQLTFMRKHQADLGLTNDQIKAQEIIFSNEMKALRISFYENDLEEFQQRENLKVQQTEAGSEQRLIKEKEYVQNLIKYYDENFQKLGLSEVEYQTKRLELVADFNAKSKNLNEFYRTEQTKEIGLLTIDAYEQAVIKFKDATKKFFNEANIIVQKDGNDLMNALMSTITPQNFFNDAIKETENLAVKYGVSIQEVLKGFSLATEAMSADLGLKVKTLEFTTRSLTNDLTILKQQMERTISMGDFFPGSGQYKAALDASKAYFDELRSQADFEYVLTKKREEQAYLDFVAQSTAEFLKRIEDKKLTQQQEEELTLNFNKQMANHKRLYEQSLTELQNENAIKRNEISKAEADNDLKIKIDAQNKFMSVSKNTFSAIGQIADAYFKVRMSNVKKGSEEERRIAKQQFDVQKGFNIGMAVINGLQSILAITSVPDFTLGVQSAIRIAAQVALNAATIAGIAAQQFTPSGGGGGGGGGSSPPTPQPFMGPQSELPAAPNFGGQFTPQQFFGLGEAQLAGPMMVQGPQRVYVLETDITEVQAKVNVIEQRASLQ